MCGIKRALFILMIMAFTSNVVVSSAMAACNCVHDARETVGAKMPCHEMEKAEQADDSTEQKADCAGCGCGHCKVPSKISLILPPSDLGAVLMSRVAVSGADRFAAFIDDNIDNPPKPIS